MKMPIGLLGRWCRTYLRPHHLRQRPYELWRGVAVSSEHFLVDDLAHREP